MSWLVTLIKNLTTEKKDWNSIKSHPILRKAFALLPFLFLEELLRLFIAIVVSSKHKSTQVVVSLLFLYSDKYHQYAKTVIALVVGTKNSSGLKINDSSCTSTEFSFGCRFSGSNLFKHSKLLKIELNSSWNCWKNCSHIEKVSPPFQKVDIKVGYIGTFLGTTSTSLFSSLLG